MSGNRYLCMMAGKDKLRISRSGIPAGSWAGQITPVNHTDAYRCDFVSCKEFTPDDLLVGFWTDWPKPVQWLFNLRNILVKPFGLRGSEDEPYDLESVIRNGEKTSISSIVHKSENETVMFLHDAHLDAYISIYAESSTPEEFKIGEGQKQWSVYTITVVRYNKRLGWFYFNAIRPFHHLIVRGMMKHNIKRL